MLIFNESVSTRVFTFCALAVAAAASTPLLLLAESASSNDKSLSVLSGSANFVSGSPAKMVGAPDGLVLPKSLSRLLSEAWVAKSSLAGGVALDVSGNVLKLVWECDRVHTSALDPVECASKINEWLLDEGFIVSNDATNAFSRSNEGMVEHVIVGRPARDLNSGTYCVSIQWTLLTACYREKPTLSQVHGSFSMFKARGGARLPAPSELGDVLADRRIDRVRIHGNRTTWYGYEVSGSSTNGGAAELIESCRRALESSRFRSSPPNAKDAPGTRLFVLSERGSVANCRVRLWQRDDSWMVKVHIQP